MKKWIFLLIIPVLIWAGNGRYGLGQIAYSGFEAAIMDTDAFTQVIGVTDTYYTVDFKAETRHLENFTNSGDTAFTCLVPGIYDLEGHFSHTSTATNTILHFSLFIDDVEDTRIETERSIGTANDFGDASLSGRFTIAANEVLKIKTKGNKTGTTTVNHGNIKLMRVK